MSAEKVANLTGEILKGLLPDAVMERGSVTNINACITSGTYLAAENSTGFPPGAYRYGLLIVFAGSYFSAQIYIPTTLGGKLYLRLYDNGIKGWRNWNAIEMSALT